MDQRTQQMLTEMENLERIRRDQRAHEKNIRKREVALSGIDAQVASNGSKVLQNNLNSFLPGSHVPGNVGGLNTVRWPFWFQADFDFGVDPTITPTTTQTASFQVTQEAAFIVRAITFDAEAYSTSGFLGPWQVQFRDRQSSRFFQDVPMPVQAIGSNSAPTVLPTPMLLMPNAFLDSVMTSYVTANQATVGSSKMQITFFGDRIRVEDAQKVLSTIFG